MAQLLVAQPAVQATLVVPYWPAQAWFQQLQSVASHIEMWPAHAVVRQPRWLHASARTALINAVVAFVRIEARPVGL